MPSVPANGVELGVESFGRDADPLVLLAAAPRCSPGRTRSGERLAAGGRRVVRYDLRDCGARRPSTRRRRLHAPGSRRRRGGAGRRARRPPRPPRRHRGRRHGRAGGRARPSGRVLGADTGRDARRSRRARSTTTCPTTTRRRWKRCSRARSPTGATGTAVAAYAADGAAVLGNDPERRARPQRGSGTAHRRAPRRCTRRTSSGWCSPGSTARRGGASGSATWPCRRSSCTAARTRSSRSATARRSPPRSPARRLLVLDAMGTALPDAAADEVAAAMLGLRGPSPDSEHRQQQRHLRSVPPQALVQGRELRRRGSRPGSTR